MEEGHGKINISGGGMVGGRGLKLTHNPINY